MADEAPRGAAKHGVGGMLRNPRIYRYLLVYFALTCAALSAHADFYDSLHELVDHLRPAFTHLAEDQA